MNVQCLQKYLIFLNENMRIQKKGRNAKGPEFNYVKCPVYCIKNVFSLDTIGDNTVQVPDVIPFRFYIFSTQLAFRWNLQKLTKPSVFGKFLKGS